MVEPRKPKNPLPRLLLPFTLLGAAVLLAGAGLWTLLDVPVQRFVIEGRLSDAERAELTGRLADADVGGILSTDLDAVLATVRTLPWVRSIGVRRAWPDALQLAIAREQPVAAWGEDAYVSASGKRLALPDEHPGLPRFDVQLASTQQAMSVFRLLDQLAQKAALSVRALRQDRQGQWRVTLDAADDSAGAVESMTVVLGAERLDERMRRFLKIYARSLADEGQRPVYADLRYANGVAIRLAPTVEAVADSADAGGDELLMAGVE